MAEPAPHAVGPSKARSTTWKLSREPYVHAGVRPLSSGRSAIQLGERRDDDINPGKPGSPQAATRNRWRTIRDKQVAACGLAAIFGSISDMMGLDSRVCMSPTISHKLILLISRMGQHGASTHQNPIESKGPGWQDMLCDRRRKASI